MENKTQEQGRKGLYESLLSNSTNLVERISGTNESGLFDEFVEECSHLRKDYMIGFGGMTRDERENGKYLLDSLESYVRGRLDVIRVREMRKALRESKGNKYGFK